MYRMFAGATSFNQPVGSWNVGNVTNFTAMFKTANGPFNQDVSGWDVSSATTMEDMFWGQNDFNQDLSGWDISNVTNMDDMLSYTGLSVANYDALLISWASQAVQSTVTFGAVELNYSSAAASARSTLVNTYGWIITDGGQV